MQFHKKCQWNLSKIKGNPPDQAQASYTVIKICINRAKQWKRTEILEETYTYPTTWIILQEATLIFNNKWLGATNYPYRKKKKIRAFFIATHKYEFQLDLKTYI